MGTKCSTLLRLPKGGESLDRSRFANYETSRVRTQIILIFVDYRLLFFIIKRKFVNLTLYLE